MARLRTIRLCSSGVAVALLLSLAAVAAPASKAATQNRRPCDIYAAAHTPCVAAFSSTRALFAAFAGPLYQVRRASDGRTRDIRVLEPGGYANASAQDRFCARTACVVDKIYDQTDNHNDLVPQGPTTAPYSNTYFAHDPVDAGALPIFAAGHQVYGLKFVDDSPTGLPCFTAATCVGSHGQAYNNGNRRARGVAVNGQPESAYGVFGGMFTGSQCCFDFGNSEIKGTDDGAGTMDAINFSRACWDACGPDGGPWVQADLENGMFMTGQRTDYPENATAYLGGSFRAGDGFCCDATSRNLAMRHPFVTAVLENPGSKTFAIKGAPASARDLTTFYSGTVPPGGYSPMRQEGAIILGSGGDQGTTDGEFFEGAMTLGVPSAAAETAVQRDIAKVQYRMHRARRG
ncbi:MAG TPA: arabinofuranosidase catalytic domain-containing protein [Mycobacteriales bacterium]|nr:arabinofuranosidase catalytic domain-containing protein [Mycobacteriales bacterium]